MNQIPDQGLLDYLTRIDELLIENTNAIKALAISAIRPEMVLKILTSGGNLVDIYKTLSELRNELENGSIQLYDIVEISLATARTGTANQDEVVEGTFLYAQTDGSLDGVGVKFNSLDADTVYFDEFNGIHTPFWRLYIINPAQSGKTLKLYVGRSNESEISAGKQIVMAVPKFHKVTTDKDTHFTGAIVQNAKEDENITGLLTNKIRITGISLQSDQQLWYRLIFWKTDGFDDTDLDSDSFCGEVEVDLVLCGFQIGGANQYYLDVRGLDLDYEDEDASNELHMSLMNLSATGKNAGGTGEVAVTVYYEERE